MAELVVTSNFGHLRFGGWWWGVWQNGRLVGFGAGYTRKYLCFKHQAAEKKIAAERELPEVLCANPNIIQRGEHDCSRRVLKVKFGMDRCK